MAVLGSGIQEYSNSRRPLVDCSVTVAVDKPGTDCTMVRIVFVRPAGTLGSVDDRAATIIKGARHDARIPGWIGGCIGCGGGGLGNGGGGDGGGGLGGGGDGGGEGGGGDGGGGGGGDGGGRSEERRVGKECR